MGFITIHYTGGYTYDANDNRIGNPPDYKSVELKLDKEKFIFNSGNFVKDWFQMRRQLFNSDYLGPVTGSSSVDHFFMDGAPYESAYLHMVDDNAVLKYVDTSDPMWVLDDSLNGIEFFVPQGTKPTFEELKELCK